LGSGLKKKGILGMVWVNPHESQMAESMEVSTLRRRYSSSQPIRPSLEDTDLVVESLDEAE
jgi:hypothetical protein